MRNDNLTDLFPIKIDLPKDSVSALNGNVSSLLYVRLTMVKLTNPLNMLGANSATELWSAMTCNSVKNFHK